MNLKLGELVRAINRIVEKLGALNISIGGDSRDYVAKAYRSTAQSINASTWTKIQINSKSYDPENNLDLVTNFRWTCPKSGFYSIKAGIYFDIITGHIIAGIYKNGALAIQGSKTYISGATGGNNVIGELYLEKGDYIELWGFQVSAGAINIASGSTGEKNFITISKINSYKPIQRTETTCKFKVRQNIAQTFANATITKINFDEKIFDPEGAFDLTNDYYIAPESGFYFVSAGIFFTSATALFLGFSTDGIFTTTNEMTTLLASQTCITLSGIVYVNKGDKIGVCARQSVGASQNTQASNPRLTFFMGHKLSN